MLMSISEKIKIMHTSLLVTVIWYFEHMEVGPLTSSLAYVHRYE